MPPTIKKGFSPVAERLKPTELETAVGMSIGSTALAQADPADVLESAPPPRPVTFTPAPTVQEIQDAEDAAPKWSYDLGARWVGMLEGFTESLGVKQALTILAQNPMPGEPYLGTGISPHAIAYLEKKNPKAAKRLKAIEKEASTELTKKLQDGVLFKDIEDGYNHLEKDVQERNENNHGLWNAVTDLSDLVGAIPALAAELFAPVQLRAEDVEEAGSKEAAERRKGKAFGKMFGGGFIGGIGETLRHPFDTFTARPFLTAVTLLPFGRALALAGKPAWAPTSQAILRAGKPAAEALADLAITKMPAVATWTVSGAEKIKAGRTIVKQYLVDGLWQGNKNTTAFIEDIIMDPRKAQSRAQSLYDRAATSIERYDTQMQPATPIGGVEEAITQYNINTSGQVIAETTQLKRKFQYKDAITELSEDRANLILELDDLRSAIEDLSKQKFERDPYRSNASIIASHKHSIYEIGKKIKMIDHGLKHFSIRPDRVVQGLRSAEEGFVFTDPPVPDRLWQINNPKLEATIDKIWDTSRDLFPQEWSMTRQKLGATLLGVLSRDSILLFKNKKARSALADIIADKYRNRSFADKKQARKVKKQLEDIFLEHSKKLDPTLEEFPTITHGKGSILFDKSMLYEAMETLEMFDGEGAFGRKGLSTHALASETLRTVAQELTSNMFVDGLKAGVSAEKTKWLPHGEEVNMGMYAKNIAREVIIENSLDPQVIAGKPSDIAGMIRANSKKIFNELIVEMAGGEAWAQTMPWSLKSTSTDQMHGIHQAQAWIRRRSPVESWRLQRLADRIEKYVELPAELGGGYAPPALARSLGWTMRINKHMLSSDFMGSFLRFMKGNVTAHNIPTHINNYISNVGMIMMKRGMVADPIRFIAKPLMKWRAFRKGGEGLSTSELRMFEAIEELGILDTDLMDAEVGAMTERLWDVPVIGHAKKGLDAWNKSLEAGYKYIGDGALKLEDTIFNYKRLTEMLESLDTGQYIRHATSPRQKVKITKTSKGFVSDKTGELLTEQGLARLKAEMASEPSMGWLFDYGDKPLLLQALQVAPILGIASPFFTWAFKALDLPGKRGLVSRALEGGFAVETNKATIHAGQIADATRIGLMRSIAVNGMRDQLEGFEGIGKLWKYVPTQSGQQIISAMTNPLYAMGMNFTNASWAGPTETLFRGGIASWKELTYDAKELDRLYPSDKDLDKMEGISQEELKDIKKRRQLFAKVELGEVWSASNALDLIGLAGSPLLDMVQYVAQSEEARRDFKWTDIYRKFGTLLTGGTLHRTLDIGIASADQLNSLSSREWAIKPDSGETEAFVGWAIRRSLGYSWTYKNIKNRKKRWFADRKLAWNASLINPLKSKIKDMKSEWTRLDQRRIRLSNQQDHGASSSVMTDMQELDIKIQIMEARKNNYSRILNFELAKAKGTFARAHEKLIEGK